MRVNRGITFQFQRIYIRNGYFIPSILYVVSSAQPSLLLSLPHVAFIDLYVSRFIGHFFGSAFSRSAGT